MPDTYNSESPLAPLRQISIFGAGAMGAVYASKFFEADPASITFLARGERYKRLSQQGVVVNDTLYRIPVMTPEDCTAPPSDLILVALKHHHLVEALPDLRHRVGDQTIILSVMNGLDSEEMLKAEYGDKVLYAVSVGIDALREGNRTTCTTQGKVIFGEPENNTLTERVRRVQALFDRVGIAYDTPVDMMRSLWWKFMINVGVNQTSAVLRAPFGVFQTSEDACAIMDAAMQEVIALAQAAHVNLHERDIQDWYTFLHTLSPKGKTSMLQDVEAARKTEVDIFAGNVVKLGIRYGIPTPVNQMLLRIIKVLEQYSQD